MSSFLDRTDRSPLHLQVRRGLIELIETLGLKPGDQLPAENVLWDRFQVSRQTLRQAVDSLVRDHVLYRQHPKGTFVGYGAVEGDLQVLRSIWEDIRRLGMEPSAHVVSVREREASEVAPFLETPEDSPVLELQRVFAANEQPIAVDTAYFPLPEFAWLRQKDLSGSWYDLLASQGIALSHARTTVGARCAPRDIAQHLEVNEGEALLCLNRQTYAVGNVMKGNRPIAYTAASFRADRYQFSVILSRR